MDTSLYARHTRLRDLPELYERDGVHLSLSTDVERVVAAVRARQALGGRCQEKIDGCYLELHLDQDGVVDRVTSRAGHSHQYAQDWLDEPLRVQLRGWTILGELVAGTHWASQQRQDGELPLVYVYGMIDASGRDRSDEVARKVPWLHHPRLRPIPEAAPGQDWGDFARAVLERGGEGVVLRQPDGRWRAKPVVTVDRYVSSCELEEDRHGWLRWKAWLSVPRSRGARTRWRRVQRVLLPEGIHPREVRRRVVTVVGASVDTTTGVVRHARLGEIRPLGDKAPEECRV